MTTMIIFHEVDDVAHWLASTKRTEVFGSRGISIRTFVDPAKTNRVGLIAEIPDMAVFQALMASPEAAEAMKLDGVRPATLVALVQS